MSEYVPLSAEELQAMLTAPDFLQGVTDATQHTHRTGNEAGFAVYRAASGLLVSEVIHAEDHTPAGRKPSDSIDLTCLTHTVEDGELEDLRPDLLVDLHTHPNTRWSDQLLSVADIRSHALQGRRLPGLISMMAQS